MRALISVYDKNGLDEFCKTLDSLGYEIYSTGGNAFWKTVIDCKQLDCKKQSTWSSKAIIMEHPANIVIQLCLLSLLNIYCSDGL